MSNRLVHDWQDQLRAEGKSDKTVYEYAGCVSRFMVRGPRIDSPIEATASDVIAFILMIDGPGSRHLHTKALRSFYRWAVESGHLSADADPLKAFHPKAPEIPDPDTYTLDELVRLVAAARGASDLRAWAILGCYGLGLRRREWALMTPEDVEWERRRVHVRYGKGGTTRYVELSSTAARALDELQPWWTPTSLIGDVKPTTFSRWVFEAARDAGLPPGRRRAHMLRSAYTTNLRNLGARIEVVQKLLGHKSITTTQRYWVIGEAERHATTGMLPEMV